MCFKETAPGYFKRDKNFKIKPSYNAFKEYNAVNKFCSGIRDRISNLMVKSEKDKVFQKNSNQEKNLKELNTLIKNKNISVCVNDTGKNMGACNADKVNAIHECDRQLQEPDVYKKLSFEETKSLILK